MKILIAAALLFVASPFPQTNGAQSPATDPLQPLNFLEGKWEAKTQAGSAGASGAGTYSFQRELKSHVLARHTKNSSGCKGPAAFDCEHSDLLYIYVGSERQELQAIYFDNEGHVIHYAVSVPDSATAIFLSDGHEPGPQFRLMYELKNAIMFGKFQMRMPGQKDWKSYLEWSGSKLM